ncbi:MAG: hypothetical protein NW201_00770 [Gemmatimonadales bacterium]|nr:hypothetical protein [Gemmatimonadales bacterium]
MSRRPFAPLAALTVALLASACDDNANGPGEEPFDLLYTNTLPGAVGPFRTVTERVRADGSAAPIMMEATSGAKDVTLSPDGRFVVFTRYTDDEHPYDLYRYDLRERIVQRLVWADGAVFRAPRYSPDGTRILYTSTQADGLGDIWVMNADGTNRRNLTPPALPAVTVDDDGAWSPDGQRIAFSSNRGGPLAIWVMRADGTQAQAVTPGNAVASFLAPAWSPDGTTIAAEQRGSDGLAIALVPAAGGAVNTLPGTEFRRSPSWSPDGKRIAYVLEEQANRQGDSDIAVMTREGARVARLARPGRAEAPIWVRR